MSIKSQFTPIDWAILGLIGTAGALGILHVFFGLNAVFGVLGTEVAAAWAQAFGSVAAILISVKIVIWQHHLELERATIAAQKIDQATEVSVLWAAQATLAFLEQIEAWVHAAEPDPEEIWHLATELNTHQELWNQRDLASLPNLKLVKFVLACRSILGVVKPQVEQMKMMMEAKAGQGFGKRGFPKPLKKFRDLVSAAERDIATS